MLADLISQFSLDLEMRKVDSYGGHIHPVRNFFVENKETFAYVLQLLDPKQIKSM